ncbi:uncharacterized protein METZ01_LOCUS84462 [marine metagenome]|uniref:Uncharacterized protein n=1 Tax=marine metagenome TaxID=408172 RepID=A0A381UVI2_9ZZZZ
MHIWTRCSLPLLTLLRNLHSLSLWSPVSASGGRGRRFHDIGSFIFLGNIRYNYNLRKYIRCPKNMPRNTRKLRTGTVT